MRRPAGRRAPWQAASTSVIATRSSTSIARCARSMRENAPGRRHRPPVWRRHSAARAFAAPDLQHDDRLAESGGAVERGGEALRLADVSIKQPITAVCGSSTRYSRKSAAFSTASLPEETMWLKPKRLISVNRLTQNPPLCETIPTLPASRSGRASPADRSCSRDRVQDAHAVRTAQRDPGLAANRRDSLLQRASFRAVLGKAAVIDHRALDAAPAAAMKASSTCRWPRQNTATSGASGISAMLG